jgi:hypothetical protein
VRPPILARALLAAVAGETEAECVAGDLDEEFAYLSRNLARSKVNRWYISQVLRSLVPLLRLRVRSGELSRVLLSAVLGVALPLLLLDRLWCLVYSQVPLKDGVDRAPGFLAVNITVLCIGSAVSAFQTRSIKQASSSAVVAAVIAMVAAGVAMWASIGSAPAAYAFLVLLLAPSGAIFGSMLRRST